MARAIRGAAAPRSRSAISPSARATRMSASRGMWRSRKARTWASGRAPMNWSTILPSLKSWTVGRLRMPNWAAISLSASVSSLARRNLPAYWSASLARTGIRARQGAHQSAQKSTRTGRSWEPAITAWWKFCAVRVTMKGESAMVLGCSRFVSGGDVWWENGCGDCGNQGGSEAGGLGWCNAGLARAPTRRVDSPGGLL